MYSVVHKGKVLDYHFRKLNEFTYNFSIDDIFIGQVFKLTRSWTAVSCKPSPFSFMPGFQSRLFAAEYILKIQGYLK